MAGLFWRGFQGRQRNVCVCACTRIIRWVVKLNELLASGILHRNYLLIFSISLLISMVSRGLLFTNLPCILVFLLPRLILLLVSLSSFFPAPICRKHIYCININKVSFIFLRIVFSIFKKQKQNLKRIKT